MSTPVWDGYFADPDVIRTESGYYAYGTDGPDQRVRQRTGRIFPVLKSDDLVSWRLVGGALEPPPGLEALHFWAPGVAQFRDRTYLYYSAGGAEGEGHQVRVAVADSPKDPFLDQQVVLIPSEPFTIDANPFYDPRSDSWWLFFAKDFLEGERPGTGVAVIQLGADMRSTVGSPVTVLRASGEWQLFQRDRHWYGKSWSAWYTVEGPFCVYRDGRYRLYFSGGLWKGEDYGVAIAEADEITGPYREIPEKVLQSRPGLRGPGHNSVVVGPGGADYICYHAWNEDFTVRQMYVDRLP